MNLIQQLGRQLQKIGKVVGNFQVRVILTCVYFLFFWPFALVTKLFIDPLRLKRSLSSGNHSFWIHKQRSELDPIEAGRRQF